ncbi:MAG TPA: hypothetical protein VHB25_10260 [Gemmatimonadaceae bacterium]|nr:hypothetical protein [Gemmatimonadaceae bacterium]
MAERARRGRSRTLSGFLEYLGEIERAVMARDGMRITALLRKRTATHLPRAIREELLLVSRAPRESLRAPVQFLRFQHRMTQLSLAGEPLPTAQTELRLEPSTAGSIRRNADYDRRVAACETDEPSDGSDGPEAP